MAPVQAGSRVLRQRGVLYTRMRGIGKRLKPVMPRRSTTEHGACVGYALGLTLR